MQEKQAGAGTFKPDRNTPTQTENKLGANRKHRGTQERGRGTAKEDVAFDATYQ